MQVDMYQAHLDITFQKQEESAKHFGVVHVDNPGHVSAGIQLPSGAPRGHRPQLEPAPAPTSTEPGLNHAIDTI